MRDTDYLLGNNVLINLIYKYMKIINGQKRYLVHCFDIENNEKTRVYWSIKEMEFAQLLSVMGVMCILNDGYFYKLSELKKAMKKVGHNPYWENVIGIGI